MSNSSGQFLEGFDFAFTMGLKYKLITSSKDNSDLSNGFDESNADVN